MRRIAVPFGKTVADRGPAQLHISTDMLYIFLAVPTKMTIPESKFLRHYAVTPVVMHGIVLYVIHTDKPICQSIWKEYRMF